MNRNERDWRAGLDAATAWAEAVPVERFTEIVAEIVCQEEELIAMAEQRDPLDANGLLSDVLAEVTPPGMRESDGDDYFAAGVRAGLLLVWEKRHATIARAKLTATH